MKAVVHEKYGTPDVLQFQEIEKPTPDENQVLVKVHAASINALDWHELTADIFLVRLMGVGLLKPKNPRLGVDFAGRVEAVGHNVTDFQPGDAVFGGRNGSLAEYVCVKNAIALKPANVSFEEAAAVPVAAVTALQGLRDHGQLRAGQKVLIHGASGGVGTFAVPLAKYLGAEVTSVCSTRNVEMARSLGADHVLDYSKADFAKTGQQYDLILAANGNRSIFAYQRALRPGGIYVMAGGSLSQLLQGLLLGKLLFRFANKQMKTFMADLKREDLVLLKELLESGKLKPFVEKCYPISQIQDAFRHFGEGHARGKIIVTMV
jgi:NADPH:quinone reductase-like Zn-dependent oxidoreductase